MSDDHQPIFFMSYFVAPEKCRAVAAGAEGVGPQLIWWDIYL